MATTSARDVLGHQLVGSGPMGVVVLNDWLCDTSTWDCARDYLDTGRYSWAFTDLRGYGRSRGRGGAFTVEEAAGDVIDLVDALGWSRFAIIGHSMSTLVALHLAQRRSDRIERVVLLTPPPPAGFGADEAGLEAVRSLARADEATQLEGLRQRFGGRLSPGWAAFKAARWRATADPDAAAGYVALFARDGLPDRSTKVSPPVLAITGEQDAPPMRSEAVTSALSPICEQLTVTPISLSGHYPMQEAPPLLVALVERFLAG